MNRQKRSVAVIPTLEEMRVVVDKHNEFRASIGSEGEEPIPSNMRHMVGSVVTTNQIFIILPFYAETCSRPRLQGLPVGQGSYEETSERWRAIGDIVRDLAGPKIELNTLRAERFL